MKENRLKSLGEMMRDPEFVSLPDTERDGVVEDWLIERETHAEKRDPVADSQEYLAYKQFRLAETEQKEADEYGEELAVKTPWQFGEAAWKANRMEVQDRLKSLGVEEDHLYNTENYRALLERAESPEERLMFESYARPIFEKRFDKLRGMLDGREDVQKALQVATRTKNDASWTFDYSLHAVEGEDGTPYMEARYPMEERKAPVRVDISKEVAYAKYLGIEDPVNQVVEDFRNRKLWGDKDKATARKNFWSDDAAVNVTSSAGLYDADELNRALEPVGSSPKAAASALAQFERVKNDASSVADATATANTMGSLTIKPYDSWVEEELARNPEDNDSASLLTKYMAYRKENDSFGNRVALGVKTGLQSSGAKTIALGNAYRGAVAGMLDQIPGGDTGAAGALKGAAYGALTSPMPGAAWAGAARGVEGRDKMSDKAREANDAAVLIQDASGTLGQANQLGGAGEAVFQGAQMAGDMAAMWGVGGGLKAAARPMAEAMVARLAAGDTAGMVGRVGVKILERNAMNEGVGLGSKQVTRYAIDRADREVLMKTFGQVIDQSRLPSTLSASFQSGSQTFADSYANRVVKAYKSGQKDAAQISREATLGAALDGTAAAITTAVVSHLVPGGLEERSSVLGSKNDFTRMVAGKMEAPLLTRDFVGAVKALGGKDVFMQAFKSTAQLVGHFAFNGLSEGVEETFEGFGNDMWDYMVNNSNKTLNQSLRDGVHTFMVTVPSAGMVGVGANVGKRAYQVGREAAGNWRAGESPTKPVKGVGIAPPAEIAPPGEVPSPAVTAEIVSPAEMAAIRSSAEGAEPLDTPVGSVEIVPPGATSKIKSPEKARPVTDVGDGMPRETRKIAEVAEDDGALPEDVGRVAEARARQQELDALAEVGGAEESVSDPQLVQKVAANLARLKNRASAVKSPAMEAVREKEAEVFELALRAESSGLTESAKVLREEAGVQKDTAKALVDDVAGENPGQLLLMMQAGAKKAKKAEKADETPAVETAVETPAVSTAATNPGQLLLMMQAGAKKAKKAEKADEAAVEEAAVEEAAVEEAAVEEAAVEEAAVEETAVEEAAVEEAAVEEAAVETPAGETPVEETEVESEVEAAEVGDTERVMEALTEETSVKGDDVRSRMSPTRRAAVEGLEAGVLKSGWWPSSMGYLAKKLGVGSTDAGARAIQTQLRELAEDRYPVRRDAEAEDQVEIRAAGNRSKSSRGLKIYAWSANKTTSPTIETVPVVRGSEQEPFFTNDPTTTAAQLLGLGKPVTVPVDLRGAGLNPALILAEDAEGREVVIGVKMPLSNHVVVPPTGYENLKSQIDTYLKPISTAVEMQDAYNGTPEAIQGAEAASLRTDESNKSRQHKTQVAAAERAERLSKTFNPFIDRVMKRGGAWKVKLDGLNRDLTVRSGNVEEVTLGALWPHMTQVVERARYAKELGALLKGNENPLEAVFHLVVEDAFKEYQGRAATRKALSQAVKTNSMQAPQSDGDGGTSSVQENNATAVAVEDAPEISAKEHLWQLGQIALRDPAALKKLEEAALAVVGGTPEDRVAHLFDSYKESPPKIRRSFGGAAMSAYLAEHSESLGGVKSEAQQRALGGQFTREQRRHVKELYELGLLNVNENPQAAVEALHTIAKPGSRYPKHQRETAKRVLKWLKKGTAEPVEVTLVSVEGGPAGSYVRTKRGHQVLLNVRETNMRGASDAFLHEFQHAMEADLTMRETVSEGKTYREALDNLLTRVRDVVENEPERFSTYYQGAYNYATLSGMDESLARDWAESTTENLLYGLGLTRRADGMIVADSLQRSRAELSAHIATSDDVRYFLETIEGPTKATALAQRALDAWVKQAGKGRGPIESLKKLPAVQMVRRAVLRQRMMASKAVVKLREAVREAMGEWEWDSSTAIHAWRDALRGGVRVMDVGGKSLREKIIYQRQVQAGDDTTELPEFMQTAGAAEQAPESSKAAKGPKGPGIVRRVAGEVSGVASQANEDLIQPAVEVLKELTEPTREALQEGVDMLTQWLDVTTQLTHRYVKGETEKALRSFTEEASRTLQAMQVSRMMVQSDVGEMSEEVRAALELVIQASQRALKSAADPVLIGLRLAAAPALKKLQPVMERTIGALQTALQGATRVLQGVRDKAQRVVSGVRDTLKSAWETVSAGVEAGVSAVVDLDTVVQDFERSPLTGKPTILTSHDGLRAAGTLPKRALQILRTEGGRTDHAIAVSDLAEVRKRERAEEEDIRAREEDSLLPYKDVEAVAARIAPRILKTFADADKPWARAGTPEFQRWERAYDGGFGVHSRNEPTVYVEAERWLAFMERYDPEIRDVLQKDLQAWEAVKSLMPRRMKKGGAGGYVSQITAEKWIADTVAGVLGKATVQELAAAGVQDLKFDDFSKRRMVRHEMVSEASEVAAMNLTGVMPLKEIVGRVADREGSYVVQESYPAFSTEEVVLKDPFEMDDALMSAGAEILERSYKGVATIRGVDGKAYELSDMHVRVSLIDGAPEITRARVSVREDVAEDVPKADEAPMDDEALAENNPQPEDVLYTRVGASAHLSVRAIANLGKAKFEDLSDPVESWRRYGWWKGADGLWRSELADAGATLKTGWARALRGIPDLRTHPSEMVRSTEDAVAEVTFRSEYDEKDLKYRREARLGDVMSHPALYKAYPWLKEVRVHAWRDSEMGDVIEGAADPLATWEPNEAVRKDAQLVRELKAAELELDGVTGPMASLPKRSELLAEAGANAVLRVVVGDPQMSDAEFQDELRKTLIHEVQHLIQAEEGFAYGIAGELRAQIEAIKSDKRNAASLEGLMRRVKAHIRGQMVQGFGGGALSEAELEEDSLRYVSQWVYNNSLGEREARSTEERRGLTAREIRETFPELSVAEGGAIGRDFPDHEIFTRAEEGLEPFSQEYRDLENSPLRSLGSRRGGAGKYADYLKGLNASDKMGSGLEWVQSLYTTKNSRYTEKLSFTERASLTPVKRDGYQSSGLLGSGLLSAPVAKLVKEAKQTRKAFDLVGQRFQADVDRYVKLQVQEELKTNPTATSIDLVLKWNRVVGRAVGDNDLAVDKASYRKIRKDLSDRLAQSEKASREAVQLLRANEEMDAGDRVAAISERFREAREERAAAMEEAMKRETELIERKVLGAKRRQREARELIGGTKNGATMLKKVDEVRANLDELTRRARLQMRGMSVVEWRAKKAELDVHVRAGVDLTAEERAELERVRDDKNAGSDDRKMAKRVLKAGVRPYTPEEVAKIYEPLELPRAADDLGDARLRLREGVYLHRNYRLYEDASWKVMMLNRLDSMLKGGGFDKERLYTKGTKEAILYNAEKQVREGLKEKKIRAELRKLGVDSYENLTKEQRDDVDTLADHYANDTSVEGWNRVRVEIEGLLNYDTNALATAVGVTKELPVSMNENPLKRKYEQESWIRELWGEYTHPAAQVVSSLTAVAQMVSHREMLTSLRNTGTSEGWILFKALDGRYYRTAEEAKRKRVKDPETGRMREETALERNERAIQTDTAGWVSLAPPAAADTHPLKGYVSSAQVKLALNEVAPARSKNLAAETWRTVNGLMMAAPTIYSPQSHARNFLGNIGLVLHSGLMGGMLASPAVSVKSAFTALQDSLKRGDASARAFIQELVEDGVLHDNAVIEALRELKTDWAGSGKDLEQDLTMSTWEMALNRTKHALGKVPKAFEVSYEMGDQVWKVAAAMAMREEVKKIHPNMNQWDVRQETARRMRMVMPYASESWQLVKNLRKTGVVGNFVTFAGESLRVAYATAALGLDDVREGRKAGNAVQVRKGVSRLAWATSSHALMVYALPKLMETLFEWVVLAAAGGDDDERKDERGVYQVALRAAANRITDSSRLSLARQFLPTWQQKSQLSSVGFDVKTGTLTFQDSSFMNPFNALHDPIRQAFEVVTNPDKTGEEKALEAPLASLASVAENFGSFQMLPGVVWDASTSKYMPDAGTPMWNAGDGGRMASSVLLGDFSETALMGQVPSRVSPFLRALTPGLVKSAHRIRKGAQGVTEESGKKYSLSAETLQLFGGGRNVMIDIPKRLSQLAGQEGREIQTATRNLNRLISGAGTAADVSVLKDAYDQLAAAEERSIKTLRELHRGATVLGVSSAKVAQIINASSVDKRLTQAIISNRLPKPGLKSARLQEAVTANPEARGRLMELVNYVKSLPEEKRLAPLVQPKTK